MFIFSPKPCKNVINQWYLDKFSILWFLHCSDRVKAAFIWLKWSRNHRVSYFLIYDEKTMIFQLFDGFVTEWKWDPLYMIHIYVYHSPWDDSCIMSCTRMVILKIIGDMKSNWLDVHVRKKLVLVLNTISEFVKC